MPMSTKAYSVKLPESPEAVVFVNGIIARNLPGFLWLWSNLFSMRSITAKAEGNIQVKAGIIGPNEVLLVSYWRSQADLNTFFKDEWHHKMMKYLYSNVENLTLWNETYSPNQPGKYIHEPQAMALAYPKVA